MTYFGHELTGLANTLVWSNGGSPRLCRALLEYLIQEQIITEGFSERGRPAVAVTAKGRTLTPEQANKLCWGFVEQYLAG
jgi:hypothetical protein